MERHVYVGCCFSELHYKIPTSCSSTKQVASSYYKKKCVCTRHKSRDMKLAGTSGLKDQDSKLYVFYILYICIQSLCWFIAIKSSLRVPHENDVRFVFTSSYLYEGSCIIYAICICCSWWCSAQIVFRCSWSWVPYVASFSGLFISYFPFGVL